MNGEEKRAKNLSIFIYLFLSYNWKQLKTKKIFLNIFHFHIYSKKSKKLNTQF